MALIPVVLFALVLSGAAAKVLQQLAAQEVKRDARAPAASKAVSELEHYVQIAHGLGADAVRQRAAQGDTASPRAGDQRSCRRSSTARTATSFGHDSNVVRLFRGDSPVDVGKSLADRRDPNGVYTNRELVNVAKNNSYYVNYSSPLPS